MSYHLWAHRKSSSFSNSWTKFRPNWWQSLRLVDLGISFFFRQSCLMCNWHFESMTQFDSSSQQIEMLIAISFSIIVIMSCCRYHPKNEVLYGWMSWKNRKVGRLCSESSIPFSDSFWAFLFFLSCKRSCHSSRFMFKAYFDVATGSESVWRILYD